MRVRAVLEQEDPVVSAVGGDLLGLERDVAADVDEERRLGLVLLGLALEVVERHAEVVAVAVDELHLGAGADRRKRRRHECVGRAQHRLPLHLREVQRGQRAARPARGRDGGNLVPRLPRLLEAGRHVGLGPAVRVEYLVDQRVKPRAVAMVEPDREAPVVRRDLGFSRNSRHESFRSWFEFAPGRDAWTACPQPWTSDQPHPSASCIRTVRRTPRYRVRRTSAFSSINGSAAAVRLCERLEL